MSSDEPKAGYGRPPKQHRFKKGQSGNPRGRPKKSLNRTTLLLSSLHHQVRAEAARLVSVREGEASLQMSVQEAFVRSTAVKAIKGDRVHAKLFHQMIGAAENEVAELKESLFEASCNYKERWEREFERCDRAGIRRPEPLPHPDDVELYLGTRDVKIVGPMCQEEKERIDRRIEDRDETIALLENPGGLDDYTPEERPAIRAMMIEDVDHINRLLPPRLRRAYKGPLD